MNETQVISMYIMYYIIQIDKQDNKNELKYNLQYNISFWLQFLLFLRGGGLSITSTQASVSGNMFSLRTKYVAFNPDLT